MTLVASTIYAQRAYENAMSTASALKSHITFVSDQSLLGPTPRLTILGVQQQLGSAIGIWTASAGAPGITQYAKDQLDDETYEIVTELNTVIAAATVLRDWINTNFPRNGGSNAVLLQTADVNGVTTNLTFSTAQLAGFRTEAAAFLATIG